MAFNDQPTLADDVFVLTPMREADRTALAAAAADPLIWAGHPAKDRHERAVFDPYFDSLLSGGGTLVIREAETGMVAGCSRFYASPDIPDEIAIGFTFLTRAHWGGDGNRRIKRLMLGHAFDDYENVWFHIAPDNIRSRKATAKLGAVFVDEGQFDLGNRSAAWARYRLSRSDWLATEVETA